MTRRFASHVGGVGIAISALVAIYAGAVTALFPFNDSPADIVWAGIYLGLFLGISFMVWSGRSKTLIKLLLWVFALLILIIFFFTENAPALLAFAWIILLSLSLGTKILHWLGLPLGKHSLERLLLGATLGLGLLGLIPLVLGSAHFFQTYLPLPERFFRLLHPLPTFISLIFLSGLTFPAFFRSARPLILQAYAQVRQSWDRKDLRFPAFWLACTAICMLAIFIWALAPTIRFDALVYHLAAPSIYVQNRGIVEVAEPLQFYWAHYGEMLFTLGLLLTGQPLPTLLHFFAGLLSAGLVFALGRRLGGTRVGLVAALVYYSLPILYDSGTAHNDLFVALFGFAAIYTALLWWQEQSHPWLILCGLMAGLALGTKINAVLIVVPLGLFIVAGILVSRRWSTLGLGDLARFALPPLLLFAPWGIRDWLWTGNPVFPFLNGIFQSPQWDGGEALTAANFASKFVSNFLLLPWNLTVNSGDYYIENPGAILGGLFLFALPWFYLRKTLVPPGTRRIFQVILIFLVGVLFLSIPYSNRVRYLFPLLPLLSVLAAFNILHLWKWAQQQPHARTLAVVGFSLALAYLFTTRLVVTTLGWQIQERYPYQVALGIEAPEAFLSRSLPAYDALQHLNRQGNGFHKVAMLGNETRLYTTSRIHTIYYSAELPQILGSHQTADSLARALIEAGFTYLVLDREGIEKFPEHYYFPTLSEDFLDRYAELAFSRNHVDVYHLPAEKTQRGVNPNLLVNPSLEEMDPAGTPASWEPYSQPLIDRSGSQAHTGQAAFHASGDAYLYQPVEVEPGKVYTLGQWARADLPNQEVRFQITWFDRWSQPFLVDIEVLPVGETWMEQQVSISAPEEAVAARVFAQAHDGSQVWIDDLCFAQGERCTP